MRVRKMMNFRKHKKRIIDINASLPSLGEKLIVGIQNRTRSGKDKNYKRFKPYTEEYKKIKQSLGKYVGFPNLVGEDATMLHAMDVKRIKNGIRIYFPDTHENKKAHGNHVKYKRKFFGLSKKQRKQIKGTIGKFIVKTKR